MALIAAVTQGLARQVLERCKDKAGSTLPINTL